jgi:hypothetical protein|tara:strand:+ start:5576 stop:5800 length:225 start_codon:yes stop_codon:yes gene_type:complete
MSSEDNIINHQSQFIQYHDGMQAYFFWDESDSQPIGYWVTRDEAALKREQYGAWVLSEQYPKGNWEEYTVDGRN